MMRLFHLKTLILSVLEETTSQLITTKFTLSLEGLFNSSSKISLILLSTDATPLYHR